MLELRGQVHMLDVYDDEEESMKPQLTLDVFNGPRICQSHTAPSRQCMLGLRRQAHMLDRYDDKET